MFRPYGHHQAYNHKNILRKIIPKETSPLQHRCTMHNSLNALAIYFMVTPCISNIQHFNNQLTHTTLKNVVIKTFLK